MQLSGNQGQESSLGGSLGSRIARSPMWLKSGGQPQSYEIQRVCFEDDVATLMWLNLVSVNKDNEVFSMHRLVQLSTKQWLELHNQMPIWQQTSLQILSLA